jgi:hypothetical protein
VLLFFGLKEHKQKTKARNAWKQVLIYQSDNADALNYLKKLNGN